MQVKATRLHADFSLTEQTDLADTRGIVIPENDGVTIGVSEATGATSLMITLDMEIAARVSEFYLAAKAREGRE